MSTRFDVISIGTLSRNVLWNEKQAVRTPHATTTLVRDGDKNILVDPSLPPEILAHRLLERTGLKPAQIDLVFLTCFRPVHRLGLDLFGEADWLMSAAEIHAIGEHLNIMLDGDQGTDPSTRDTIEQELALLGRLSPAPDMITHNVHLFPLAGASPGSAGLLLTLPGRTVVIAGDAVLTRDHLEAGRVFEHSTDVEQALEALTEIFEIADLIVPGHDNVVFLLQ